MTRNLLLTTEQEERAEKAKRAVEAFRKMLPNLTNFARALTRNPHIRVVMIADGAATVGNTIGIQPPMELGDDTRHDRVLCGKRDDQFVPLCKACSIKESILVNLLHEISHHAAKSFERTTEEERSKALVRALHESPSKLADRVKRNFNIAPESTYSDYMGLASLVSPFIPPLFNQLDDIRVDFHMFNARKGTKKMYKGDVWKIYNVPQKFIDRNTGEEKELYPRDYPLNTQIVLGLWIEAMEYDYSGWLHPQIEAHLKDETLSNLIFRVKTARNVGGVWALVFPILDRLRQLGYLTLPEEEPEDEQPQPSPEGEEADSGDQDEADEEGQDESETSSMGSDDASEDGPPPPEGESEAGEGSDLDDESGDSSSSSEEQSSEDAGSSDDVSDSPGSDEEETGGSGSSDSSQSESSDSEDEGSDSQESGAGQSSDREDARSGDSSEGDGEDSGGDPGPNGVLEDDGGPESEDEREAELDDSSESSRESGEASDQSSDAEGSSQDHSSPSGESDGDFEDTSSQGSGDGGCEASDERGGSDRTSGDSTSTPSESMDSDNSLASDSGRGRDADDLGDPGDRPSGMDSAEADDSSAGDAENSHDDEGSKSLHESDGEDGEPGPLDSGVYRDDAAVQAPALEYGGPEGIQEAVDYAHKHGKQEISASEEDSVEEKAAIVLAMLQSAYFETASMNVRTVREHKKNKHVIDNTGDDQSIAWTTYQNNVHNQDYLKMGGVVCDMDLPRAVLSPCVRKLRRIFTENRVTGYDANRRHGKINNRVLGRRGWDDSDGRLFGKKNEPEERDYFVIIAGDISYSQHGMSLALTKRAMKAQAELCHQAGIAFAVYAHSAITADGGLNLEVYEIKSERERWTKECREALDHIACVSGNLDGHAIEYYRRMAQKSSATDRIIMYYSDGKMPAANYEEELMILQREIKTCKRLGIHLMGVGMRTDSPARHGLDTVQVDTDDDLIKVVDHIGKMIH